MAKTVEKDKAFITLDTHKLKQNYLHLDALFEKQGIQWSVVTKLLCGNRDYLKILLDLGIGQVCDSRIANLKTIKSLAPHVETIFIKPPAKRNAANVIAFADISFNTSYDTVLALSQAACAAGKTHRIVIMVELGELREGVLQSALVDFYEKVSLLPNIEVIGLGTNFTCMYGILPSYEKLQQLEHYKELIEKKYNRKLSLLSGGASVTIPLIENEQLPEGINHFRVGETLFFGTDVYNNAILEKMQQHVLKLYAEIIEIHEKPNQPSGEPGYNLTGEKKELSTDILPGTSMRAIVDIGLLDIDTHHIVPVDKTISIAGASSDMTVLDLGSNKNRYKVGNKIGFYIDYMGALRLMNSRYVEKRVADDRYETAQTSMNTMEMN